MHGNTHRPGQRLYQKSETNSNDRATCGKSQTCALVLNSLVITVRCEMAGGSRDPAVVKRGGQQKGRGPIKQRVSRRFISRRLSRDGREGLERRSHLAALTTSLPNCQVENCSPQVRKIGIKFYLKY